jgi:hypothetical protein
MDDLLKEAIADAKAVRETALENAKMALEEAFTPRLQSMLSKKIQTELEDEEEDAPADDEAPAEDELEGNYSEEDEDPFDADSEEEPADDEMEEEGVIEINGVKYAPVVEQDDEEEEGGEEEDEEEAFEDLDLEAVIKELETELDEADEVEESKEEVDEAEEVEESNDVSSGIGSSDNKQPAKNANDDSTDDPGKGKLKENEEVDESKDEVDEDIDLDEVLKALSEEEDEEEEVEEVAKLRSDLDEHRSVIETLRGKLNEVNLLNAKLLFTNKLFRKYGLNNEQKMKVVEQFDRASTLREVKLVYSTLGESFGTARNEINESKGAASKPVASTKSEKEVITESSDLRDRFKKLANLI